MFVADDSWGGVLRSSGGVVVSDEWVVLVHSEMLLCETWDWWPWGG